MKNLLIIGLRTTLVTLVLTGVLYPLALTAIAQLVAPAAANGSLVSDEHGQIVGSELIGQSFSNPAYFQPRPSAAGEKGYDATASTGSNLGPTSQKLRDRIVEESNRLRKENPAAVGPIPAELVTTSGSGLDPELSPVGARWQVPRVAQARRVDPARVLALLDGRIEGRTFGVLGEPRVNVLMLNLALDRQFGRPLRNPPKAVRVPKESAPQESAPTARIGG
jgi:K+-transporting ATPase ATPase C chain